MCVSKYSDAIECVGIEFETLNQIKLEWELEFEQINSSYNCYIFSLAIILKINFKLTVQPKL